MDPDTITAELADLARGLITGNHYLTLGTADVSGTPWVSPVFFTPDRFTDFYWVSSPQTRHSRNLAARPQVSMVIYDSHSPVGGAEAVYMSATAVQVPDEELERAADVYNSRLPDAKRFAGEELLPPALFRLYRATVGEHSVLIRGGDPRFGRGADSRMTVAL
ncbi:pyridoxamine 5'-phosphate oxidase family protein [Sphaerisporangium sp. TRM90804]|uniref:pyridoxamine 5'-phosphate oxidase family protein n=1 Tax=Sphaerisporangium sp. TRM90804 TaxID=3031113 RepID=UPI00244C6CDB|nr:pyridoxamine 5'-phosphate oxidase family protein [Sphaerisporangium sp. TRM90804]MDH2425955.1 pyridoxamine 5'-phosphate oxidase family protein [Sphaerisporangium sp. TRM90804]